MNCTEIREQLSLHLYGDLPASETAQVERHLADCAECRSEFAALGQVRLALESTPAPEVCVNPSQIFLTAVQPKSNRRWLRWASIGGLAASLLLFALFNLEMRIDRQQLVVRWGRSAEKVAVVNPQPSKAADDILAAIDERIRVLQEVTHALAGDVERRDRNWNDELIRTRSQLDAVMRSTGQRIGEAQRDVDALYAAHFKSKVTE